MSIIFSVGCIVIGQLLLRHHTVWPRNSAEDVVSSLDLKEDPMERLTFLQGPLLACLYQG